MTMNRAQFKKQLQEGLNTQFGLEYKRHPDQWREYFEVENSSKAYEEDVLLAGLGPAQTKAEGGGVSYDEGGESYVARYVHETIALAFSITEEAEEDGLYGKIGAKYSKGLARSLKHTKEIKGASVLNNGFSSSYAIGDGKALFATDHPLWGGGTLANTFTTQADLAETSLEEAIIKIDEFVDDRNIPIIAMAKKLVVPTDLRFTADRLLNSTKRPGTADNDINAINHQSAVSGGHCVANYLTDADAWFLITDVPDGLKHFVRVKLKRGVEGDFETGNMRYKARERYSFGVSDFRGAWGSQGAA